MLNEEQTKALVQILDNLIDDYDKSIGQMEEQIGATVPGSMRIKNRKIRRCVIREIRTEIANMGDLHKWQETLNETNQLSKKRIPIKQIK